MRTKWTYGVGLTAGLDSWKLAFEFLHGDYFHGVEFPAEFLSVPELPRLMRSRKLRAINVFDLAESSLCHNLPDQPVKVQLDFARGLDPLLRARTLAIRGFTIDLGLANASRRPETLASRVDFIKLFYPALYQTGRALRLPARVPDTPDPLVFADTMELIIRQCLFPGVRVCLNVYPHEAKDAIDPREIYRRYRFHLDLVRIVYEPRLGNYLTPKLLEYWLEPLAEIDFNGAVIFCPQIRNFSLYEREIAKITGVLDSVGVEAPAAS